MPPRPAAHAALEALGAVEALDVPAKPLAKTIRSLLEPGPVKDALSGTWLGHALHPLLTDVPIGAWTSAVALDWVGGESAAPAARRLIGLGLLAAGPTAATGWTEWADAEPASDEARRVGIVHAAANITATACFAASWVARGNGGGRALGLAGFGALMAGGWLGGHLAYSDGIGVKTTAWEPAADEWSATGVREDELGEGAMRCASVDGAGVLLARQGGRLHALANRCVHRGGPLHEGELGDGTVTCPLHGSVFALEDGSVRRGPAAYPQPAYEVRSLDGSLEVRAKR